MTPSLLHDLLTSPDPLEVSEADASLLVRAGLAQRVESHYTMVVATEEAWGMSEGEAGERLALALGLA